MKCPKCGDDRHVRSNWYRSSDIGVADIHYYYCIFCRHGWPKPVEAIELRLLIEKARELQNKLSKEMGLEQSPHWVGTMLKSRERLINAIITYLNGNPDLLVNLAGIAEDTAESVEGLEEHIATRIQIEENRPPLRIGGECPKCGQIVR